MNCCSELDNKYEGMSFKDLSELHSRLENIETDYNKWATISKCSVCGQVWVEQFKQQGHGEVPEIFKK